ncbi:uncharacterized protein EV422DRAFT_535708 [Fimicolochytrium jonesii]|uniref:uncharacterized protein n=1 Tax=Fimicolochytrium jonesii TaxID=1396493 RepID=UPI0022FE37E4|nr:uncharacterized protein EV422DRAFT_535708 [Fimicolochytrium jonesii]KAI8819252.1 hypothetical protein EV422DRAFT_535708 [Fimicolochytrium jonesii]
MPPVHHFVSFKYKPTLASPEISASVRHFTSLNTSVTRPDGTPLIRSFIRGENSSPEGLHQGHTHGFLLVFASTDDRDTYLAHPAHVKFATEVKGMVDGVYVFDINQEEAFVDGAVVKA